MNPHIFAITESSARNLLLIIVLYLESVQDRLNKLERMPLCIYISSSS